MSGSINPKASGLTPESIICDVLEIGIEPISLERLHTDMLLHYIRKAENWELTVEYSDKVMFQAEIITNLLRQIDAYARQVLEGNGEV